MVISVSINGVLRDILSRFEEIYNKYHEEGVTSPVITPNLIEYTNFKDDEELLEFLYSESPMEIFGQAKEVGNNIISHLTELYKVMPDGYKLRIVSDDIGRAKSATLWFLAKYGTYCDEIIFSSGLGMKHVWDTTDIFITSSVEVIVSRPPGKKLVIVDQIYNEHLESDLRINNIKEINSFDNVFR
jgi:hypothetical protein